MNGRERKKWRRHWRRRRLQKYKIKATAAAARNLKTMTQDTHATAKSTFNDQRFLLAHVRLENVFRRSIRRCDAIIAWGVLHFPFISSFYLSFHISFRPQYTFDSCFVCLLLSHVYAMPYILQLCWSSETEKSETKVISTWQKLRFPRKCIICRCN